MLIAIWDMSLTRGLVDVSVRQVKRLGFGKLVQPSLGWMGSTALFLGFLMSAARPVFVHSNKYPTS